MSMCQITASLYFGREDPKWQANEQHTGQIKTIINKFRFGSTRPTSCDTEPPQYGFRGFILTHNNKTYNVYRNLIECTTDKTYALDSGRTLESLLIQISPVKIRSHLTSF